MFSTEAEVTAATSSGHGCAREQQYFGQKSGMLGYHQFGNSNFIMDWDLYLVSTLLSLL